MIEIVFWQTAAAVFIGNCLFAAFAVALMNIHKSEKTGGGFDSQPWWVYACALVPLGSIAAAFAFLS